QHGASHGVGERIALIVRPRRSAIEPRYLNLAQRTFMASKHSLLVAAVCALPLSMAACGSSDSGNTTITPEGTHYGYVVSKASVPTPTADVNAFGLDLGSKTSVKPDGIVDNALGQVFSSLTMLKFDIQGTITAAVDQGNILLLLDFQTKDFTNASASG